MTERIPHTYSYTSAGNTGQPVHPMCAAMAASSHSTQRDWCWQFERSLLAREFTCPKCGSHMFGTSHCLSPFPEWIGHCHGHEQWSCDFTWNRQTQDHEVMKASPAAGESAPISPEVPQAELERCEFCNALERSRDGQNVTFWCGTMTHGNRGSKLSDACHARQREVCYDETTPATPSAAVGADEPGAGDADKLLPCPFCGGKAELIGISTGGPMCWSINCGGCSAEFTARYSTLRDAWNLRAAAGDTVPRSEYDLVVKLINHIRDVIAEYDDMATADRKPTNVHNQKSEDTLPVQLEYGKRYVNRVGRVTAPLVKNTIKYCDSHPFYDISDGTCYQDNGRWSVENGDDEEDLIAEYHEPDPQPAESPDDWVMITDPKHVLRSCDEVRYAEGSWHPCRASVGATRGTQTWEEFRCRRKDLPVVPAESPAPQPSCSPVCALCGSLATCFGQYADYDKGFACDSCCGHGNEDGWCMPVVPVESPSLPQFPEGAENNTVLWEQAAAWTTLYEWCRENGMPIDRDLNGLQTLAQWILDLKSAAKPQPPNSAPADKPRMRQVTLREWEYPVGQSLQKYWGESFPLLQVECSQTGRTAVVEVPE